MLTRRQEVFAAEFLVDLNATQAALRAGYSPTSAAEQGSRLLTHEEVAAIIERGIAQRIVRVGMRQDEVLRELSLLAHSRIDHYTFDSDGFVTLTEGAPEG